MIILYQLTNVAAFLKGVCSVMFFGKYLEQLPITTWIQVRAGMLNKVDHLIYLSNGQAAPLPGFAFFSGDFYALAFQVICALIGSAAAL